MLLEVDGAVSGYEKLEILHGVSIEVQDSRIVALIGPNGAGKSTLLKTIFGYIRPVSGGVLFEGKSITGLKPSQILRRGISYVPQGRSVFSGLTVMENLRMGGYIVDDTGRLQSRMLDVFKRFPILLERKNQVASTLSGGEQRMLELARAMLLDPKLILLDEPSLGLAPRFIDNVYERIRQFRDEQGKALLIVEQNVRKALSIANYVYVLDVGRIAYEGVPEGILASPKLRKIYLGG